MNNTSAQADTLWKQYRDNFSRHLLGVARYLQTSMMNTLQQECGHENLRLGFAPYITLIGEQELRPTELAELLGITRQACNQAIKQIEAAGYIGRTADPQDRRAIRLTLTPEGQALRKDGVRIVGDIDSQFTQIVSRDALNDARKSLAKIYNNLPLGLPSSAEAQTVYGGMGALLPRLSDHVLQRLMELTRDRGHPGLKLSFGQVLTLIGPSGGRIQQMAAIQDVSKQAISAIASDLEELGYLTRRTDSTDARQVVLQFTDRGRQLIADSVASVEDIEREFSAGIGQKSLKRMKSTMRKLYEGLQLEQDVFGNNSPADIHQLARQLRQQLGQERCQVLAKLLLSPTDK